MALTRALWGIALLAAAVLLAGCTAAAETVDVSGARLADGAIEITSSPVPVAAFEFCADRIAADKAAKAAAIAAANRKARAARAATTRAPRYNPYWYIDGNGAKRARFWRCPACDGVGPYIGYCPYCRGAGKSPLMRPGALLPGGLH